ncbi:zonular occludens toxin domain-containing protein [Thalassolituus oleivorans]|uniref:zonular occludens toxin domain-containing protein n=1 Tax=Thalassolituus oleivorans TaxID=187493 RepID=UPI0023F04846|nr:zonular occludens toxin domain-containing protein [Thalassolituus oleivorans]
MSISAYTGLPGHGKSYGVVDNVIRPALEQKREIFTNIPMNSDECLQRYGMTVTQFKTDDIIENPNWWTDVFTAGSLIVIDELWRLWPAGLNAKNVRDQDKSFLAEHRHLVGHNGQSTEIIFVTQDLSQIANFARTLVETTFRVTKLSKIGMDNRFRVDVYFGPVTGASPPISKRDREIHGKFDKKIYALYQSHTKSVTGDAGNERRVDGRFNALGGLSIKLGIVLVILSAVAAYLGFNRVSVAYHPIVNEQSSSTQNTNTVENTSPVLSKQSFFEFLSRADEIYISYNNGRFPRIEYRFQVLIDDNYADFTPHQLTELQYEIQPINECMVKIIGADYRGYAMCKRSQTSGGWMENIVTSNSSDPM